MTTSQAPVVLENTKFGELEFRNLFMEYMELGGHTYHKSDIDWAWSMYQLNSSKYDWMVEFKKSKKK